MADSKPPKEPFIAKADRPEVKITLDTPISELRVRELTSLVRIASQKSAFEGSNDPLKNFFDKDFPEVSKDWVKEAKAEKAEHKEKEKEKDKEAKHEKLEVKEIKAEKAEVDHIVSFPAPDPGITQLIQAVSGLTKQVSDLANQIEVIKKKVDG